LIRAVLFDLGETLVTCLENVKIHQVILKEKKVEKTAEEVAAAIIKVEATFGARHSKTKLMALDLDTFYEELNSEVYKELGLKNHRALGKYAHKRWFDIAGLRMYDDVMPVLNRLSASGIKLGLVTNGYCEEARDLMSRVWHTHIKSQKSMLDRPGSIFSTIVGRDTVGAMKPDPRPFLHAAGSLGLKPNEIMFVGDRYDKDYIGSQAVGMVPVLILRGRELPAGVPRDITKIRTMDELVNLVG